VGGRTVDVDATGTDQARSAAQPLARSLFGSWVLPFELLSLLLLAALVAALVLSRAVDRADTSSSIESLDVGRGPR
jgi:NADH:ubiquinone oxidoreductase subunit 6 (subunit J)